MDAFFSLIVILLSKSIRMKLLLMITNYTFQENHTIPLLLTNLQNFLLVLIESICRRQNKRDSEIGIYCGKSKKKLWEK